MVFSFLSLFFSHVLVSLASVSLSFQRTKQKFSDQRQMVKLTAQRTKQKRSDQRQMDKLTATEIQAETHSNQKYEKKRAVCA